VCQQCISRCAVCTALDMCVCVCVSSVYHGVLSVQLWICVCLRAHLTVCSWFVDSVCVYVCVCVCVRASVVHIAVCLLYSRGCVCLCFRREYRGVPFEKQQNSDPFTRTI